MNPQTQIARATNLKVVEVVAGTLANSAKLAQVSGPSGTRDLARAVEKVRVEVVSHAAAAALVAGVTETPDVIVKLDEFLREFHATLEAIATEEGGQSVKFLER